MKGFSEVFAEGLKEIYSAECQFLQFFPELIAAANNEQLKQFLEKHERGVKTQIEHLKKIALEVKVDLADAQSDAMQGLVQGCKKLLAGGYETAVLDAALMGRLQGIKFYERSMYGALRAFAQRLKLENVGKLLLEIAKEEKDAERVFREAAFKKHFGKEGQEKMAQFKKKMRNMMNKKRSA